MSENEKAERLQSEILKGDEAETLLKGIQPYFTAYSGELYQNLKKTKFNEVDKREEYYRQLKAVDTLEALITTSIQTGKMARTELSFMGNLINKLKVV